MFFLQTLWKNCPHRLGAPWPAQAGFPLGYLGCYTIHCYDIQHLIYLSQVKPQFKKKLYTGEKSRGWCAEKAQNCIFLLLKKHYTNGFFKAEPGLALWNWKLICIFVWDHSSALVTVNIISLIFLFPGQQVHLFPISCFLADELSCFSIVLHSRSLLVS